MGHRRICFQVWSTAPAALRTLQTWATRQIRKEFQFTGTPIWIKSRARKRRDFVPGPSKKK